MVDDVQIRNAPPALSFHCPTLLSLFPSRLYCASREMGQDNSECEVIQVKRRATFRLCNVSSYTTEILEIRADDPTLHVVVIPGNPAVGHISQTKKSWEHGRLFSLQEQINHKMDVIKQELQNNEVPILLVGHSIGSYISVEMFKRSPEKVPYSMCCLQLYCCARGFVAYPTVEYHTMRNVLFMAMTEFRKLSETPDWAFMRENQHKIAFLFGIDDHWGPLQMFEEISKQIPDAALSIEREDLTDHGFCCTEAGSLWVAEHVAKLIKNKKASQ
ncbi:alpha/beta-Hydrolases superfamily protein [Prunus dulcis]|uniref:Alpha/beta-Hydrolases superfamily protein n=1 Tax=Prunus dulcis TaxID=3755 RepID=A0A4Y1RUP0_PRUDU|nr:alpha/beta-Hydrolases superfamily protein [Prunus dulcis]